MSSNLQIFTGIIIFIFAVFFIFFSLTKRPNFISIHLALALDGATRTATQGSTFQGVRRILENKILIWREKVKVITYFY